MIRYSLYAAIKIANTLAAKGGNRDMKQRSPALHLKWMYLQVKTALTPGRWCCQDKRTQHAIAAVTLPPRCNYFMI